MIDIRIYETRIHPSKPNFNVPSSKKPAWLPPFKAMALTLALLSPGSLLWVPPGPQEL